MGATPYVGGVTFRVWAPFARSIAVAGDFNGWSAATHLLSSEGNGYWSTDVAGAAIGAQYKFVVVNRDTGATLWRNDPYARELTNSNGNSVVADPDFTWTSANYKSVPWDDLVVYELGSTLPGPGLSPETQAIANQRERRITSALGEIKQEYRVALVLREIEELSYEEIAETLGLSLGTVKSRLWRARSEMKTKLESVLKSQSRQPQRDAFHAFYAFYARRG